MPFDGNPNAYETEERTRILRDWVHELRHGGHVQICRNYHNSDKSAHCAIGVLILMYPERNMSCWIRDNIALHKIVWRNDGDNGLRRHTFSEIADYIESEWLS